MTCPPRQAHEPGATARAGLASRFAGGPGRPGGGWLGRALGLCALAFMLGHPAARAQVPRTSHEARLQGILDRQSQGDLEGALGEAAGLLAAPAPDAVADPRQRAEILLLAAASHARLGRHRTALDLQLQALGLVEPHERLARVAGLVLNNLGATYTELGEYAQARQARERSLQLWTRVTGPQHPLVASALNNLASSLSDLGDPRAALPLYLQALAIRQQAFGPQAREVADSLSNVSLAHLALGDYQEALRTQEQSLALRERLLGPMDAQTGISVNNLASVHAALGNHRQALALRQRALSIAEQAHGPDHPRTAASLGNLALALQEMGDHQASIGLLERALAIQQRLRGRTHPAVALALGNLAGAYKDSGQPLRALPLQLEAVRINETMLGPDHPATARSIGNLATIQGRLGQYREALALAHEAAAIWGRALGPDHPQAVLALGNLAEAHRDLGNLQEASRLQGQVLAWSESRLGPDHPQVALACSNLGLTRADLGEWDEALALARRALEIGERVHGSASPGMAIYLNNLADIQARADRLDLALPLQERALAIERDAWGAQHANVATALGNLARMRHQLGQDDQALDLQQQAVAIRERTLPPEHPHLAQGYGNLAAYLEAAGRADEALVWKERALALREQALGRDHPQVATSLNNLAFSYFNAGQFDRSLPLQQRALAIRTQALGRWHPDTALSLANLAITYGELGRLDEAMALQLEALAISQAVAGMDHRDTAARLKELGRLWDQAGQPDLAILFLKRAVNTYQVSRQRVAPLGAQALQSYTGSVASAYRMLAEILAERGHLAQAQTVLDLLKESEQFEFTRRAAAPPAASAAASYTATERAWMQRYDQISAQLAALGRESEWLQRQPAAALTAEQRRRQGTLAEDLAVARRAFEAFMADLRQEFEGKGAARAVDRAQSDEKSLGELKDLLRGLGEGVALLQLYVTDTRINFLLTTPGVQLARSTAIRIQDLHRQVAQFSRLLRDPQSDPRPAAQALYQVLLAPVAKDLELAGARTVMLSLDGALRYVPFAALHDGTDYLVRRMNLSIFTSVARERLREPASPGWRVAGLGVTRGIGEFAPLPAVRDELNGIVRAGGTGGRPGEIYLDEAFTARQLRAVAGRQFPVVHVASHFRFSPGTEADSFLLLGDGQKLSLGEMRTQDFRFDGVDLLTLSACETGLGGGRDESGREIEGFGVLAQRQGAKAVLATLWPVADQSTSILMRDMYQRYQQGAGSKAAALRGAQARLAARTGTAHPYYWAPFILMGNWK